MDGKTFPEGFFWGVASSAYQVEGSWNKDGKSPSVWDFYYHNNSDIEENGDTACDSYQRINEDLECLKQLKVSHYRFSLSWCRILPNGHSRHLNEKGIAFYNNFIDKLLENDIMPIVTIYHWDLPQCLEDLGGWLNKDIVKYFTNYARICFKHFGDRVKYWITINEPILTSHYFYGIDMPTPGIKSSIGFSFDATHHQILAHASAYHLYVNEFKNAQQGLVGWALNLDYLEPFCKDNPEDVLATDRLLKVKTGIFADPIYGNGDYPEFLKIRIEELKESGDIPKDMSLPEFTDDEIMKNKNSADFFGLNYYTGRLVKHSKNPGSDFFNKVCQCETSIDPSWKTGSCLILCPVPWGLRKLLKYISDHYKNYPIFIFENGTSDPDGNSNDEHRIIYITDHLRNLLEAIYLDDVNVIGYTYWSLLDSFEWMRGYKKKFGLFQVDQNDPEKKRIAKKSVKFYAEVIKSNKICSK